MSETIPVSGRIQWVQTDGRLTPHAVDVMTRIIDIKIDSDPPSDDADKAKVTNLYVDTVTNEIIAVHDGGTVTV